MKVKGVPPRKQRFLQPCSWVLRGRTQAVLLPQQEGAEGWDESPRPEDHLGPSQQKLPESNPHVRSTVSNTTLPLLFVSYKAFHRNWGNQDPTKQTRETLPAPL